MTADAPRRIRPLDEMSLAELREHRRQLREEEHRVSYWRRLVQARLDTSAAGRLSRAPLTPHQIAVALGDGVRRHQRLAMLMPGDGHEQPGLPALPELARLWATPLRGADDDIDTSADPSADGGHSAIDAGDDEAVTIAGLAEAEALLSTYRAGIHRLLDAATAELIRRYRADPAACLDVLPVEPPAHRAAG
jgi:hypothetical protein